MLYFWNSHTGLIPRLSWSWNETVLLSIPCTHYSLHFSPPLLPPPVSPFPLSEMQRELKLSESHCQVLAEDKAQLESQLAQLTNLSGDSSKQLSFLSEQLKEKER